MRLPELAVDPAAPFPSVQWALRDPDGLLARGGDLSPTRLLNAYRHGIFPWYSRGQPILWWSPDPRTVFDTSQVHLSRRFLRSLRRCGWCIRADTAFASVIASCARIERPGQSGTWITREMQAAYLRMQELGHAHSIEVWDGESLVGGLYGVAIGHMFFGESMFSARSGGSKVALAGLAHVLRRWGWPLIDAQVPNAHLDSLGAQSWPRQRFLVEVAKLTAIAAPAETWTGRVGRLEAAELEP